MKVALTGHRPQIFGMSDDELDDKWRIKNEIICDVRSR